MKVGEIRAQLGEARHARLAALAELLEVSEQEVLRRLIDVGLPALRQQLSAAAPDLPSIALESPADRRQIAGDSPSASAASPQTPLSVLVSSSVSSLPESLPAPSPSYILPPPVAMGERSTQEARPGDATEVEGRQKRQKRPEPEEYPADFEKFWAAYPNKVNKAGAFRSWLRATKKPPLPELLAALDQHKRSERWLSGYVAMPTTWLNQQRWQEKILDGRQGAGGARASPASPNPSPPPGTDPRATMLTRRGWMTLEQYAATRDD